MKWRRKGRLKWFNRVFPELIKLPEETRLRLLQGSNRGLYTSSKFWVILIPLSMFIPALIILETYLFPNNPSARWLSTIASLPIILGVLFVGGILIEPIRKQWLNNEINILGFRPSKCLICSYDLRGTLDDSTACPECGAKIAPITPDTNETT